MLRYVIPVLCVFFVYYADSLEIINPGPKYPPTKGEVWPKPQHEKKENDYFTFNPSDFKVNVTGQSCTTLTTVIERYSYIVKEKSGIKRSRKRTSGKRRRRLLCAPKSGRQDDNYQGGLQELHIELTAPCEDYPYFEMEESYNLTVSTISKIRSDSLWGIMRGLETFAQLFYLSDDYNELRINKTEIVDYPRYAHRGLLIDTARHYISLRNILLTLEAMVMNKMNVLHWHIVDDQSFPYQSEKFPELSERGAYHPSMVYTKSDIENVIEFARLRGIRVIPEFDVPGHTRSWGVAYPNILTECYELDKLVGLGPLNPIQNITYKLLRDLFQEVQSVFPDKYFHIGGDEVDLDCWSSNPVLITYMAEHGMTSVNQLHALFMENAIPLLGNSSKPIVWQEVFDEKVPLSDDTLIQVWKYGWTNEMIKVLSKGHRVIFSSSWYLDSVASGGDWEKYYTPDPRRMVNNDTLAQNIVGGEACMWAEVVDDRNILNRVWPRASAVAERLWSAAASDSYMERRDAMNLARHRIEEHTCRMNRRGVPAQPPNGPGFCVA